MLHGRMLLKNKMSIMRSIMPIYLHRTKTSVRLLITEICKSAKIPRVRAPWAYVLRLAVCLRSAVGQ